MVLYGDLTKAEVLCALYNSAKQQGLGLFQRSESMTIAQAEKLIGQTTNFDYLNGRVLKVDLSGDKGFDEWLYDRDNGKGSAQRALDGYHPTYDLKV